MPADRGRASWLCRCLSPEMSRQRQHALQIFRAALEAADPYEAVLQLCPLRSDGF